MGVTMPKGKPRENKRKDIWLTDNDSRNIQRIVEVMIGQGIPPAREGKYTLSQIVRFVMDEFVKDL